MNKKNLKMVAIGIIFIALLILLFPQHNDHENSMEQDVETAGESVQRVINDGADALRSAAEGVNDAVYKE